MTHFKPLLFLLSSVLLTLVGGVLGAAPLLVLRRQLGGLPYWLMGMGMSVLFWGLKMPGMSAAFFANIFLIGVFTEIRKTSYDQALQALASVTITFGFFAASFYALAATKVYDFIGVLIAGLSRSLELFPELSTSLTLSELLNQTPSLILVYLMLAMALALILEKNFFALSDETYKKSQQLSLFRLPDSFIWVLIASLLATFGKFNMPELQMLGANLLNLSLFAYFFQGISVVTRYFEVFKVGRFWRIFGYLLFTTQVFAFTSVLGVVDYWVDFRSKFTKRAGLLNKNKLKSKLGRGKSRGDS